MASLEDDGRFRSDLWLQERTYATVGGTNRWHVTGVAIKSEPIYPLQTSLQLPSSSCSPPLKRRRSEEPEDLGEKRQRVASIAGVEDDMGMLFEQAAAAAARHIQESTESTAESDALDQATRCASVEHSEHFTSEPHRLAQVLSLPMLESLVSCRTAPSQHSHSSMLTLSRPHRS